MKNKKVLLILFFSITILFFLGYYLLQIIKGTDGQETIKSEIIGAILIGALGSLGLWSLYNKSGRS